MRSPVWSPHSLLRGTDLNCRPLGYEPLRACVRAGPAVATLLSTSSDGAPQRASWPRLALGLRADGGILGERLRFAGLLYRLLGQLLFFRQNSRRLSHVRRG